MSNLKFQSRPRVIGANAHKYIGQNVSMVGEVTNITTHANTLTITLPDDESIIALLQKNSTTIEPNLLTEISGRLVSRGQVEVNFIRQWDHKATSRFNKSLYVEAAHIFDAQRRHLDI